MDRELLLEIGCEELPAAWLPDLADQLGQCLVVQLDVHRLSARATVETYATPRRLTARIEKVSERQADREALIIGPPVSVAFGADGQPTGAGTGFARKQGVELSATVRHETPKGTYLAYHRRERSNAAVDVLPDVLAGTLRSLRFAKQMRWDAWLEDGRGEFPFGRPIRWLLYLYGGRVVPFCIRRTEAAQGPRVEDVWAGASTYGHRFLATSGRAGRAIKVRTFDAYRRRLEEHFVVLERNTRRDRIVRELDIQAKRLGGRVRAMTSDLATLLEEVPDLVEYPTVVAGTFPVEFLDLPEEVLTTTMVHHQHFFPIVDDRERLKPAFLAVANASAESADTISQNAERVLTARLRDARFFWESDRRSTLESRVPRLDGVLLHKRLGSYGAKAARLQRLATWIAAEAFGQPDAAAAAGTAARLAKTDLVTDMVREFTELQGTMGGIYARQEGQPEAIWKAIYYHYEPVMLEPDAPPTPDMLGSAAVTWAAVSLADKLDTIVGLFTAGEQPTGSRDPFGVRRQAHGVLRVLVDLPALTKLTVSPALEDLVAACAREREGAAWSPALSGFFRERLQHLFDQRGFRHDEIRAVFGATGLRLQPLDLLARLAALQATRTSEDFEGLAVLFKRVKNIVPEDVPAATPSSLTALTEPAERALVEHYTRVAPELQSAAAAGDYRRAFAAAAGLRASADRFFTEVFVMVDDMPLRIARLTLLTHLRDSILELADISEIVTPGTEDAPEHGGKSTH